jgi:hypothetical protein
MTRQEEAEFWKTRDATDYLDDSEPVEVEMGPHSQNHRRVCGDVLLSRYIDVELAAGRAVLRGLRELYCRQGHETRLAPETKRIVNAVKAVLDLVPDFARSIDHLELAA